MTNFFSSSIITKTKWGLKTILLLFRIINIICRYHGAHNLTVQAYKMRLHDLKYYWFIWKISQAGYNWIISAQVIHKYMFAILIKENQINSHQLIQALHLQSQVNSTFFFGQVVDSTLSSLYVFLFCFDKFNSIPLEWQLCLLSSEYFIIQELHLTIYNLNH